MKKILTITASILIIVSSHAQFKAGIHTGVDFNTLHLSGLGIDLNEEIKYFNSFRIGVHGEYELSEDFSLISELNYTKNGFRMNEGSFAQVFGLDLPIGARVTTHLNYLEVPLLLKYKFGSKRLSYFAEAGPSVAYGMNGKIKPQASLILDINLPEVNIDFSGHAYNRWLVGANVGMGMAYAINEGLDIQANMRYTGTLNSIVQDQVIDLNVKSNTIHLGVGVTKAF